ncbi:signal recognition particle, SRP19 subunit [Xylariaceae sp. FL0594]|nr:signal recognition particle, SRP19 subunit [Xylariaceae sp. FL0594]
MSRAMIEEVSDSDDDHGGNVSDPSEGDIDDFTESDILRSIPLRPKQQTPTQTPVPLLPPQQGRGGGGGLSPDDIKDYQMLYPIYFDASRSRAEGRRVPKSLAVANPLAREIANACASLRLAPVYEAHRTHPKDWANPGRVRVLLKSSSSSPHTPYSSQAQNIKNKHHLYILVARYLAEHPTTESSPSLRTGIGLGAGTGMGGDLLYSADASKPWPRPAVPKGWKINDLLPAFSAAMTGGGVSENAFKDMMREMQGAAGGAGGMGMGMPGMNADMMSMLQNMGMGGGGGPGGGGGEGSGKKVKKGKK